MGSTTFIVQAQGRTAKEAFLNAIDDARHEYGHGMYTGSIAEKESMGMLEIDPPKEGVNFDEYADKLTSVDTRFNDKFKPAGCFLVKSDNREDLVLDKIKRTSFKPTGTRKWETVYVVYKKTEERGMIEVGQHRFKDDATKQAISVTKAEEIETLVVIEKRLLDQSDIVFRATPTFKKQTVKGGMNTYLFFGWASA